MWQLLTWANWRWPDTRQVVPGLTVGIRRLRLYIVRGLLGKCLTAIDGRVLGTMLELLLVLQVIFICIHIHRSGNNRYLFLGGVLLRIFFLSFIPRGNDIHFTVVLLVRFGALAKIGAYQWNRDDLDYDSELERTLLRRRREARRRARQDALEQ
ncbi:hypothetical protein PIB30_056514 [Stylosanthes scabra]|uniref:Uncharacterized protein n=1 Tax=Stylosanthes scabra TaxID=79078 RepID=A0ABU6YKJ0_9FABA|nr:hypothetical protein [Stylosanthes scabra]